MGVFVARVVPGGQSQRAGLKENDRILKINNKVPANVNDAVSFIKKAGRSLILSVERAEPHEELQEGRLSRSGSVRSFNTAYGASRPQSPGDSEGEEDEVTRHQRMMAAHQAELQAKEAAIAEQYAAVDGYVPMIGDCNAAIANSYDRVRAVAHSTPAAGLWRIMVRKPDKPIDETEAHITR